MNGVLAALDRSIDHPERSSNADRADRVNVFVIFDVDHDYDLFELLRRQSDSPACEFSVIDGSTGSCDSESARDRLLRRIHRVDQVIVICGEHTGESPQISSELVMARSEHKPYMLLWGRRGVMCTKPIGAASTDGMYSWTSQFLHAQIAFNLRGSATKTEAGSLRKPDRVAPA